MNLLFFAGILMTSLLLQATPDPEQAVRSWYRSFDGYAGVSAQYQGYVGDTSFDRTYSQLATSLKARISDADFKATYAEVAHIDLLQVHVAQLDTSGQRAEVFVEEERTVVFNGAAAPEQRVPGVSWYEGTLELTRTSGAWQISAIRLHPEDIISVNYGGHQPWRNDPVEVSRIAVQGFYGTSGLSDSCVTKVPATNTRMAEFDVCGDSRYHIRIVQLHSGEWRVIHIEPGR